MRTQISPNIIMLFTGVLFVLFLLQDPLGIIGISWLHSSAMSCQASNLEQSSITWIFLKHPGRLSCRMLISPYLSFPRLLLLTDSAPGYGSYFSARMLDIKDFTLLGKFCCVPLKSVGVFLLLLFGRSVMSDCLWPRGRQHTGPPCPSPSPGACSYSCLWSRWCHPTISSSVVPFSSCPLLSQHQGLFQWVSSSHQVAKVLKLQHQSFQRIFRVDFL